MTSRDWPNFNVPGGWRLASDGTVITDRHRNASLGTFYKESQAYLRERDSELRTYLNNVSSARRFKDSKSSLSSSQQTQLESPQLEEQSHITTVTMRKKGKFKRAYRRRRPISASLRSRSVPFRMVFAVTTTAGVYTKGISMKTVAHEYLKTFDEFRCVRMFVRFVPSALTTEGVYTTVLLDGPGFGTMAGSAPTWFTRIGDMPGSVLRHCASGFLHRWRPTSPGSRNWIRLDRDDVNVATVYIASSDINKQVIGAIHITGSVRVRGEYNAAVTMLRRYTSLQALDDLSIVDPTDDHNM